MITPVFRVTQNETHVKVQVHAPHARLSDAEVHVEEDEVKFFASPYFLR